MKTNKSKQNKYKVPNRIWYLVEWSLIIFAVLSLIVALCTFFAAKDLTIVDRLLYFPRYCVEYEGETGLFPLDLLMKISVVFFFTALVTLFFEVYKYIIECRRIKKVEQAIYNSFLWTRSRTSRSKIKYIPWYKPFETLKVKFGYSEDEILRACAASNRLRAANLASTRSFESYPHDRLVVECYFRNTNYGSKIDRNSPVTIVVPSTNFGLSKFGFYLSLLGGFNFISKENTDYDTSERFLTAKSPEDSDIFFQEFIKDAKDLVRKDCTSWVIELATLVARDGNKISIYHSKENADNFYSLCDILPDSISDVSIDKTGNDFSVTKQNILNEIVDGQSSDSFAMRISNETLVWNPARIKIVDDLAHTLCEAFGTPYNQEAEKLLTSKKNDKMVGFHEKLFVGANIQNKKKQ